MHTPAYAAQLDTLIALTNAAHAKTVEIENRLIETIRLIELADQNGWCHEITRRRETILRNQLTDARAAERAADTLYLDHIATRRTYR